MEFLRYVPLLCDTKIRPPATMFEHQSMHSHPARRKIRKVCDQLTAGFGVPIKFNDWQTASKITSYVHQPVIENTWYCEVRDFSTTIYLTSEAQLQYLILVANEIDISVTNAFQLKAIA